MSVRLAGSITVSMCLCFLPSAGAGPAAGEPRGDRPGGDPTAAETLREAGRLESEARSLRSRRDELLKGLIRAHPDTGEAWSARTWILAECEGPAELDAAVRKMEADAAANNGRGRVNTWLAAAHAYERAGRYREAIEYTARVVEDGTDDEAAAHAHISMADLYARLGDERQKLHWLTRAASLRGERPAGEMWGRDDTRGVATERLAQHYMAAGDWAAALRWWEQFEGYGWCGANADARADLRAHGMGTCLTKLGRADEATRLMEGRLFARSFSYAHELPVAVVDSYRAAGRLDELEKRLRSATSRGPGAYHGASAALRYIGLIRSAAGRDMPALWAVAAVAARPPGQAGRGDWESQKAAEFLVAMGDPAEDFADAKLQAALSGAERGWALLVLVRLRGEAMLPALEREIEQRARVVELREAFYAVAQVGTPAAWDLIRRHAAAPDGLRASAARETLERFPPPRRAP